MSDQSVISFFLLLLFASSLLVGHNGFEEGMALSEQEDEEFEKQLLLINKPAVTTIHTDYGDIIDCVDFYKQPAFDHPLLKNHTFHYQMKPISVHRGTRDQVSSKSTEPVSLRLKGGGCSVGTVPIRRITKGDLIRERLASTITSLEDNSPNTHYAVVRTRANSNKKFIGAGARISVEAPNDIEYRQYSAAKMKIQNGPDSIEVGWRDQANGNWWLEIGPDNTQIGFWSSRLFTGLGDLANHLEWGGEAFGPPGTYTPPMGRNFFPSGAAVLDASIRQILVLNEYGQTVDIDKLEEYSDNNNLYKVYDRGNFGGKVGHYMVYGGPRGRNTQV